VVRFLVLVDNAFVRLLSILLYTILTSVPLACAIATACPFWAVLCDMSVLITLSTLIDLTLLEEGLAMMVNLS
jgi:hypothetical protein